MTQRGNLGSYSHSAVVLQTVLTEVYPGKVSQKAARQRKHSRDPHPSEGHAQQTVWNSHSV